MNRKIFSKDELKSAETKEEQRQFLKSYFGLDFKGSKTRCPFHDDKEPSLSTYVDSQNFVRYHCFGCGVNEDIFGLIQKLSSGTSFGRAQAMVREFVMKNHKGGENAN